MNHNPPTPSGEAPPGEQPAGVATDNQNLDPVEASLAAAEGRSNDVTDATSWAPIDDKRCREMERAYRGRIVNVRPARRIGTVESSGGRRIDFSLELVRVYGYVDRASLLRTGMRVTFDLSNTARGPRIQRLWVGNLPTYF